MSDGATKNPIRLSAWRLPVESLCLGVLAWVSVWLVTDDIAFVLLLVNVGLVATVWLRAHARSIPGRAPPAREVLGSVVAASFLLLAVPAYAELVFRVLLGSS